MRAEARWLLQLVLDPIWQVYQALQEPASAPALLDKVVARLGLQVRTAAFCYLAFSLASVTERSARLSSSTSPLACS